MHVLAANGGFGSELSNVRTGCEARPFRVDVYPYGDDVVLDKKKWKTVAAAAAAAPTKTATEIAVRQSEVKEQTERDRGNKGKEGT